MLLVGIGDLRRQPGTRSRYHRQLIVPGLEITSAHVPEGAEIDVDLELEALSNGLVATGTITVPWLGECRRCLAPVESETSVEVREIFEPRPVDGETYKMSEDAVDLEPMIRDAVLLALPLAPLCAEDCPGPAPDAFPTGVEGGRDEGMAPPADPRWAALGDLNFDSSAEDD
jgi:uncharacterized protein